MPAPSPRARANTVAVLIGSVLLLVLVLAGLGGRRLLLAGQQGGAVPEARAVLENLEGLYSTEPFASLSERGRRDLFATDHFNKPKTPPAKKTDPPPAKTRNVPLTYLGLLGGGGAAPTVYVRTEKETLRLAPGSVVVGDWRIAVADRDALVLTNGAAATNTLQFRRTQPLEVSVP